MNEQIDLIQYTKKRSLCRRLLPLLLAMGLLLARLLRRDGAFGAVFRYRQPHSVRRQHACRFGAGAGT